MRSLGVRGLALLAVLLYLTESSLSANGWHFVAALLLALLLGISLVMRIVVFIILIGVIALVLTALSNMTGSL